MNDPSSYPERGWTILNVQELFALLENQSSSDVEEESKKFPCPPKEFDEPSQDYSY